MVPLVFSTWWKDKVEGIQFIINSTAVLDLYWVPTDTQSPGIGIQIRTEKVRSVHPLLISE